MGEKLEEMDIQGDGNGISFYHVVCHSTTVKTHVDPSKSFSRRSVDRTSCES